MMKRPPRDVTDLLLDWSQGDQEALDQLMPLVYDQLRRLATVRLRRERGNHTLVPTALVHEAYLKLIDQKRVEWQNRAHFFGVAARLMRRVLGEHARRRQAAKRGGNFLSVPLKDADLGTDDRAMEYLVLDDALSRLAAFDPRQERIVELRFFAGLTIEETSTLLAVSVATVKREWRMARAWLTQELAQGTTTGGC